MRATHNLTANVRGDSWRGLPVIRIRINSAPPAVAVASAKMHFRRRPDDETVAMELSTASSSITITSAANWEFAIPPVLAFPLDAGTWHYDFETINAAGFKRTYFGGTMTITRDVTR